MPKMLESDTCYQPGCTIKRMMREDWRIKGYTKSSRFCVYHFMEHYCPDDVLCPRRKPQRGLDWMRQEPPPYPHTQDVHWPHPEIAGATPTMEWPLVLVSPA